MRYIVKVTRGEYAGRTYAYDNAAAARRKRDRLDYAYGATCAYIALENSAG